MAASFTRYLFLSQGALPSIWGYLHVDFNVDFCAASLHSLKLQLVAGNFSPTEVVLPVLLAVGVTCPHRDYQLGGMRGSLDFEWYLAW